MTEVCSHNPRQPSTCLACCLADALPAELLPTVTNMTALRFSCLHLGRVIDYRNCGCPMKHVHQCDQFGTCTLDTCQNCPRYVYDGPNE
jgi:hypothetical protein